MKKSVNIAGIVFLLILFTGIIFKRLHFPGAGIMITISIFLFIVVYLPAFLISIVNQMKSEGKPINKLLIYLGSPGIVILAFGILAKIMHWPGAAWGLWGGIGIISLILLVYVIISRKSNENISMISVLIVTILLGSFSFNMFRIGNIRPMEEAYSINGTAFSESSRIFWKECENTMTEKIFSDTTVLASTSREEIIQIHKLVQETDLTIGNMLEQIKTLENSAIGAQYKEQKADAMNESLTKIILGDDGLPTMDRKIGEFKSIIAKSSLLTSEEKTDLTNKLVYLFESQEAGLEFKYLGIYSLVPEVCTNTLLLWKSKVWETESKILRSALEK
jgi:hypothetical protein